MSKKIRHLFYTANGFSEEKKAFADRVHSKMNEELYFEAVRAGYKELPTFDEWMKDTDMWMFSWESYEKGNPDWHNPPGNERVQPNFVWIKHLYELCKECESPQK